MPTKKKPVTLKAGALIEPPEDNDGEKQPSKRQLLRLEDSFNRLPTHEVLRRVYKRHNTGLWEFAFAVTWVVILVSNV